MAERLAPEVRRLRILETAMDYIAEEGYRGLTLRGLARRCGMSAPGLMHYFADMPTLLMAVLDHRDAKDQAAVAEQVEADRPTLASMREVADRIVDRMASNPQGARLFAMVQAESLDPKHPAHHYFLERGHRAASEFAARMGPDVPDAKARALRFMAILDGLQLSWLRDPDGFDIRAHWAAIAPGLFADA
ncbi:MAG: TetR/AcrR family transcriptional regulator [Actinobacteria bacterium HGW-Actinobacteria-4]|nr:MAG: TetR/AcrR family transcriptional regulator [Actinobacteria bacterium HGW-Actinobacteria-4]